MASFAALIVVLSTLPAAAPSAARDAARSVLSGDYQTELPESPSLPGEASTTPGSVPGNKRSPVGPSERRRSHGGDGGGTVLLYLLYTVLAVGLAFFVASIVRDWRTAPARTRAPPRSREAPRSESIAPATGPAAASAPLERWETLAAEGRFEEAVHALLIAAIAGLRARTQAPPDSATSREILRSPAVPAAAAEAFGALVGVVETSRFGGRPVDAADYDRARSRFEEWRAALAGGRA